MMMMSKSRVYCAGELNPLAFLDTWLLNLDHVINYYDDVIIKCLLRSRIKPIYDSETLIMWLMMIVTS